MRLLKGLEFDPYRVEIPEVLKKLNPGAVADERNGAFVLKHKDTILRIIASNGGGWDHVSVSTETRCPTWEEMEFVKRRFFKSSEVAMQLHVPPTDHVNNHPFCLHLWRPHRLNIPMPPPIYV